MGLTQSYKGVLMGVALTSIVTGSSLALIRPAAGANVMPMGWSATTRRAGGTVTRLHQRLVHVTIHNFTFQPARLVVSPGTTVVWTNTDSDPHTVDSTRTLWTSDALDTDGQFKRAFKATGAFSYYCSIHPYMHGVIVVKK